MELIQISALENGAHNNFTVSMEIELPDGYAVVPDTLQRPKTFPFVKNIAAEDGVVVSWEADEEAYNASNPLRNLRESKEAELSVACNAAIVAGIDVETTRGTEHFDLTETDQINLTTALGKVEAGAVAYPYHSKGGLCRMFTADEIKAVSQAAEAHAMYHQTLCNHLLTWARRSETAEELEGITYTAEGLPEDLAANMAQVLAETAATGDLTDKEVSA